jgi:hypothetical protein
VHDKELAMKTAFHDPTQEARSSRTIVVLSTQPPGLLEALVIEACEDDVVIVATLACAYSRIRQLAPDLVMVFVENDDETAAACELLSMLRADRRTPCIRIVTWPTERRSAEHEIEDILEELIRDSPCMGGDVRMN